MEIRKLVEHPNLKDVARESGKNPSTVSSILKGKGEERRISKATQQRVWFIAESMGYYGGNNDALSTRATKPGAVTWRDIAQETGLSVAAVYDALRGSKGMSERTQKRAREVAERIGYVLNQNARNLRTGLLVYTSRNP